MSIAQWRGGGAEPGQRPTPSSSATPPPLPHGSILRRTTPPHKGPRPWLPPRRRMLLLAVLDRVPHRSRPILALISGMLAALLFFLLPILDGGPSSFDQHLELARARHDFAHTAMFGAGAHARYAFPVLATDARSLLDSATMQLTHTSRRAISVAYTKSGKATVYTSRNSSNARRQNHTLVSPTPRLLFRWSHLADSGVPRTTDLTTGEGIELVRDYRSYPSSIPVFLSRPWSLGPDHVSPRSPPAPLDHERVLCMYVFSATDEEYTSNLHNFIRRVVQRPSQHIDYVFLINQLENKFVDIAALPPLPPNARYIQHRNECYDWGTIGWILDIQDELASVYGWHTTNIDSSYWLNLRQYKYYIVMNSSVRGPWFPSYVDLVDPRNVWYSPLLRQLTSNPGIGMVGPIVSCQLQPHLQSYILMTDAAGLEILKKEPPDPTQAFEKANKRDRTTFVQVNDLGDLGRLRDRARHNSRVSGTVASTSDAIAHTMSVADLAGNGVFGCHSALEQAIIEAELGASRLMIEAGYNLGTLARMYGGVDFRRTSYQRCFENGDNPSDNPLAGWLMSHGPLTPARVQARMELIRANELFDHERTRDRAEYQELLDKAAHLSEHKNDNRGVAAAIVQLIRAIPVTPQAAAAAAAVASTDITLLAQQARALVTPSPARPMPPSTSYLSSRSASVDAELIYLDVLEVLFGKFKANHKTMHITLYHKYVKASHQRRIERYVAEFVRPVTKRWEDSFRSHRYRALARREGRAVARAHERLEIAATLAAEDAARANAKAQLAAVEVELAHHEGQGDDAFSPHAHSHTSHHPEADAAAAAAAAPGEAAAAAPTQP